MKLAEKLLDTLQTCCEAYKITKTAIGKFAQFSFSSEDEYEKTIKEIRAKHKFDDDRVIIRKGVSGKQDAMIPLDECDSEMEENKLPNAPIFELQRKLKSSGKFKNIEVIENKGIPNELHADSKDKNIHFVVMVDRNGWFSMPGKSTYYQKHIKDTPELNKANFDKIFNADKVIDIINNIIKVASEAYNESMTTGSELYNKIKEIVDEKSMAKIDGVKVDLTSANIMLNILDNLKPSNKDKALSLGIKKLFDVAMKVAG
jgi:hypothetical protein